MVILNRIIEYGIVFLIVFTPLAFGSVHPWAYTTMGLTICMLVIISVIRLIISNFKNVSATTKSHPTSYNSQSTVSSPTFSFNRLGLARTPLNISILLFTTLIIFQLVPLPSGFLKLVSSNTYNLYREILPGWQNETPFPDQSPSDTKNPRSNAPESSNQQPKIDEKMSLISKGEGTHSNLMPISIYPYATKMEFFNILILIGMFFIITNTPNIRTNRIILTIIGLGFFISLLGIMQRLSETRSIYWLIESSNVFPFGPYFNRNHFAGYICMVIPLAFGMLIFRSASFTFSRSMKHHSFLAEFQSHLFANFLLLFATVIMISALFMSLSRGGIMAFFVSTTGFFIFVVASRYRTNIGKSIGTIFFILTLTFVLLAWIGLTPTLDRLSDFSSSSRLDVYKDTINIAKDFPIFGTGMGTFEYIYRKYKTVDDQFLYEHAHNDYLELLSDMGIIGFLIVMAGIIMFFWKIMSRWRKRRDPYVKGITLGGICGIIAILVHSLVDFNLHIPANALLLSIILGLVCNTINLKRSRP